MGRSSAVAGAMLLGVVLSGCASQLADAPLVGLPANTPARPATPGEYLPVHDVPAPRQETELLRAALIAMPGQLFLTVF